VWLCTCYLLTVQAYEKDVEEYRHETQLSAESVEHIADDQTETKHSSVVSQLETSYQALVTASSHLLANMDSAVQCYSQYSELAGQVAQTLDDVESVVEQCSASALVDTESALQHQLHLVTTAANRVAGLAKLMTDYERASTMTLQSLSELALTDSSRCVHTIQQDVESSKTRFTAVQRCTSEQQRLVNSALAQLQDPAHNLAVLLHWVSCSHAVYMDELNDRNW